MNRRSLGTAMVGAAVIAFATAGIASAHVVKQFGPYSIALGWLVEPTYVGEPNAVIVIVKDAKGDAVNDVAAGDLTVTVSAGGQSTAALPLDPSFDPDTGLGTPGAYTANLIPTLPGDYTFHLSGSVHGTTVDETATSSDTTFNAAEDPSSVQFPAKVPTTTELSAKVDRLDARVQTAADAASAAAAPAKAASDTATAAMSAAAAAQASAADASSAATRALVAGVVLGGLGLIAGVTGILLALRARKPA
jgi:hypothetical protein